MTLYNMEQQELINEFHRLWDSFPGMVRLIDRHHKVIAANEAARRKGFVEGSCCSRIGPVCSHKGCKSRNALLERKAFVDRPNPDTIRGWMPITDINDMFIHFTIKTE